MNSNLVSVLYCTSYVTAGYRVSCIVLCTLKLDFTSLFVVSAVIRTWTRIMSSSMTPLAGCASSLHKTSNAFCNNHRCCNLFCLCTSIELFHNCQGKLQCSAWSPACDQLAIHHNSLLSSAAVSVICKSALFAKEDSMHEAFTARYLLSDNLSTKPGCAVAFLPAKRPCASSTIAGAAHMAA